MLLHIVNTKPADLYRNGEQTPTVKSGRCRKVEIQMVKVNIVSLSGPVHHSFMSQCVRPSDPLQKVHSQKLKLSIQGLNMSPVCQSTTCY